MKNICCLCILLLSNFALANEGQLGIILGSTTGLSGKFNLDAAHAVDGALSYSAYDKYGINFHADYLVNKARQFPVGGVNPLILYYGIGVRLINIRSGVDNGKSRIGVRTPIGLYHQINNPNLEIFGELAPVLDLTPGTDLSIDVGLGVRFRF